MYRSAILMAALVAVGDPALAQQPGDIVVEGVRNRDQQILEFVEALTPAPRGGQISRFERKVCPAATGLPEAQNARIVARLRLVAETAGIPLGTEKCKPNALLIVADNKDEFIAAMRKQYPSYFVNAVMETIRPDDNGAVSAWHVGGVLDANGQETGLMVESSSSVETAGGGSSKNTEQAKHMVTESTDSSRLMPSAQPHFVSGVVVINRSALGGLTITQLADYGAMRLYGQTEPGKLPSTSPPTILKVIGAPMGSAIPQSLTQWDLGFLKSLYATDGLQFATVQRAAIRQRLRKELDSGGKDR